ncbi:MAG: response regulator [Proteobacteria bacterium]|nr:response regulator [Pseudomonadota bacterium]
MSKKYDVFRILVVDDNNDLRSIIKEYLSDKGDLVDGACDGKDALHKHMENNYDLIITDLNMPEMTGIDLMKKIRKNNNITEFIIITAYASLDTAVEAIKIGAFDYIVKPFRMEELKVIVKNAKDKIFLVKTNIELFKKLKKFYDEIERYRQHGKSDSNVETPESGKDTERIVDEIKNLEKLVKGRLMIE